MKSEEITINSAYLNKIMMDKFEYKILNISRSHLKKEASQFELIETLNKLGEESWELINTEGLNEGSIFWKVGETTDI